MNIMRDPHDTEDGNPYATPREIGEKSAKHVPHPWTAFVVPLILAIPPMLFIVWITWLSITSAPVPLHTHNYCFFGIFGIAFLGTCFRKTWALWLFIPYGLFLAWGLAYDYYRCLLYGRPDYGDSEMRLIAFGVFYCLVFVLSCFFGIAHCFSKDRRRKNHADA